jgi:hypothetical protein
MLLLTSASETTAQTIKKIDSYGIYVAGKSGYVKVEPYSHDFRFVDFRHLNEVPFVIRDNDKLTLIVYEKDFTPSSIGIERRPIDIHINLQSIRFSVKPLDKTDMYEVTLDSPLNDGAMLQVQSWTHFNNFGVIMLGDTQEQLVKYFSQKELSNAIAISQYLDDVLVAFPDNTKLQELSAFWKSAATKEKDKNDYAYVEEKWQQYETAEKLSLKQRYLKAVIAEINGYLNAHPDGAKAVEAKHHKAEAEKKLEEYEKLL